MAKRKAETGTENSSAKPAAKVAKKSSSKGADEIGLKFKDFEKSAPNLSLQLFESKSSKKESSSSDASKKELLALDLSKTMMATGSYGYTSSGKRIMIEVEVDGKKQKVPALISINVTVVGSKKVDSKTQESE